MNVGNLAGTYLGMKLVNGKIKPKYGVVGIIGVAIMIIIFIALVFTLGYGIMNVNLECILMSCCGIFGFGYLLLISPYFEHYNHRVPNSDTS